MTDAEKHLSAAMEFLRLAVPYLTKGLEHYENYLVIAESDAAIAAHPAYNPLPVGCHFEQKDSSS